MATIRKEFVTTASVDAAWEAMRDVGALHTRLVPGFVTDTKLEGAMDAGGKPSARIVTFANGVTIREPIITIDDGAKRVVWSAESASTTHYNSSVTAVPGPDGTRVIWTSDFLPDTAATTIDTAMTMGSRIMKRTLDKLAG